MRSRALGVRWHKLLDLRLNIDAENKIMDSFKAGCDDDAKSHQPLIRLPSRREATPVGGAVENVGDILMLMLPTWAGEQAESNSTSVSPSPCSSAPSK